MTEAKRNQQRTPDRPRRGRPSKSRAASIVRDIHAAALRLFMEHGFETVTMDVIAAEAGISKSTLYTRFETKSDLFRKIIADKVREWGARVEERTSVEESPASLRSSLGVHARTIVASRSWMEIVRMERLVEEVANAFPDLANAYYEIGQYRFLKFIAADIAKYAEQRITMDRCLVMANMLLLSISEWHRIQSSRRPVSESELNHFANEVVEIIALAAGG